MDYVLLSISTLHEMVHSSMKEVHYFKTFSSSLFNYVTLPSYGRSNRRSWEGKLGTYLIFGIFLAKVAAHDLNIYCCARQLKFCPFHQAMTLSSLFHPYFLQFDGDNKLLLTCMKLNFNYNFMLFDLSWPQRFHGLPLSQPGTWHGYLGDTELLIACMNLLIPLVLLTLI